MSKHFQRLKLTLIVGLSLLNCLTLDMARSAQSQTTASAVRPRVGRPIRQGQGASRGDCPQVTVPLTALVPLTEGKTLSAHPTFWFYIPYTKSTKITVPAKFSLRDSAGNLVGHDIELSLPTTPSVIGVHLPATTTLEPMQSYRWFFAIYCTSEDQPPISVEGSVQRLSSSLVKDPPFLDVLTALAEHRLTKPQDVALLAKWKQLLNQLNFTPSELEEMTTAPLSQ